jgi:ribosomal protein S27AE
MATAAHDIEDDRLVPRSCPECGGILIPTRVVPDLYVSRRGNDHLAAWSAAPLDAWTCQVCGRTDFYADNIEALAG